VPAARGVERRARFFAHCSPRRTPTPSPSVGGRRSSSRSTRARCCASPSSGGPSA
jgi:hypothetical protein